jgi:arylsulfatase A-like enzyme
VHPGKNGFDEWLSAPNFYDNNPILSHKGKAVQLEGESSMIAAERALQWIGGQVADETPFLAVVWFGSPHNPHRAIEEDRKLYDDQPENKQHFYGEITGMDRAFGKLRQGLKNLGVRDNTILWYCSDNGALPNLGSSGGRRGNKGNIYEGGLLVPSILEWPARIKEPRVTNVRSCTYDIYPTLLEIVGVEMENQPPLDGVSLLPLIALGNQDREKPLGFWDYPRPGIGTPTAQWMAELFKAQSAGGDLSAHASSLNAAKLPDPAYPLDSFPGHAAWIDGDWKLHRIQNNQGKVKWELYNLAQDPKEQTNLAENEPDRTMAMQVALEAWQKSVTESLNGEDYAKK